MTAGAQTVYTRSRMTRASRLASVAPALLTVATLGVLASCALVTGCEKPEARSALGYTEDARRAYEVAMDELRSKNYLEAQQLFREVKRKYHYSKYAKLAELRISDADFDQEKYAEAIRGYRQFVHDHRSDAEEVSYARSKIAEAQYKQIGDSFLLPSADERDQAIILDTFKELRSYAQDYPRGKDTARIRELLADVVARLMRHELYVSRFYLDRDNFEAAVLRIQYAMRNFAQVPTARGPAGSEVVDSGLEAEALLLLGEVYLKMKKYTEARSAFESILRDFARSPLVGQAGNFLAYMKERGV